MLLGRLVGFAACVSSSGVESAEQVVCLVVCAESSVSRHCFKQVYISSLFLY